MSRQPTLASERRTTALLTVTIGLAVALTWFAWGGGVAHATATQDRLAKERVLILQGAIERHGSANQFRYPKASLVRQGGGLALPLWPRNPFTGKPMSPGTGRGQYVYSVLENTRDAYTLRVRLTRGAFEVQGTRPAWVGQKNNALTRLSIVVLRTALEDYAFDNNGVFPAPDDVKSAGPLGAYLTDVDWPVNPVTGLDMARSTSPGDFQYSTSVDSSSFTLAGNLPGGGTYPLGPSVANFRENALRLHFKDRMGQNAIQVIKDYVDLWATRNAGVLPTEAQLAPNGAVGYGSTWWPQSPWVMGPMSPGDGIGQYTYTINGDGTYTLVLHEQADPAYPDDYPADYVAQ